MNKVLGVLALFLSLLPFGVHSANCKNALERLENSRLRSSVLLARGGRPAILNGYPLHFTSNPVIPQIWLTRPGNGSEYFVVEKGSMGFGFSPPPTSRFRLIDDETIHLRSLDFSGDNQNLMATLIAQDSETGEAVALLKLVNIGDSDTGELQLLGVPGLEIRGIHQNADKLVVTARMSTKEFWITDGGKKIRIVELQESGEPLLKTEINLSKQVDSVTKIQFFQSGEAGYLRLKRKGGSWAIVPFYLSYPKSEEAKTPVIPTLKIDWEKAYEMKEDYVRTSVHPSEPIIVISYKDHIEALGFNIETQTFTKVLDQKIDFLTDGQEILGVEYYWNGALQKVKTEEGVKQIFVGNVEAALLVGQNNRNSTLLYWLDVKGK